MVGLLAKKILLHFTQKSLQELNFTRKKNSGSQEGDGGS